MTDQQTRRELLYSLLGDLPPRDRPVKVETIREERTEHYLLEVLVMDLNGIEPVPAYFTRPHEMAAPGPVMVYNHAHGGGYDTGKEELIRPRPGFQRPPYAEALARQGISSLCIDAWNFGERTGRTELELFKEMLWNGQVLWGMMMYDTLKATDYLASRPEVEPSRIGSMGLSMGSTSAWWHAAMDERVKVCVDICCLTDFHALIRSRGLDGHGIYYYVPSLLKHFSTSQINVLICPRAHLSLAGIYDKLTPPDGLDRIDESLRGVYAAAGVPERWELVRYHTGHFETADMRARILRFLEQFL